MVRIVDLEELDLRAELGDDGRISRVLDQRGNEMGLVAAKTDPLTGGITFRADGIDYESHIGLLPSGDTTGFTDRENIAAAIVSAAARKCHVVLGGGQFYVASTDVASTNADKGIPLASGVEVCGSGYKATKIKVVGGSKCNIFVAENINSWAVRNLYLDGNRDDPSMPITGGSQDNLRNCIRVYGCSEWEVSGCTLTRAAYHGIIGVRGCKNVRVFNNDFVENGFRPVHLHDESGFIPGKISVIGNRVSGNGTGVFPGLSITAEVQGGALNKLRVSADDAVKLTQIYAAGITTILVAIPNAGPSGNTHFSIATLSVSNPDVANDLTLALAATQASGQVNVRIIAEMTSGIFVVFGCETAIVANNIIYDEIAQGIHVAGSSGAESKRVLIHNNIVDACGVGMVLGSNDSNATTDITATGNKVTNSVFEGVQINTVKNFTWDGEIDGSGTVGARVVTVGTQQESIRISGVIRNSGATGVYCRGSGELGLLEITANLESNGKNSGFTGSSANYLGTYSLGFGMGAFINPDAANKVHSVVVDVRSARKNTNGACHVNYVDHARVSIKSCIDNVALSGGAAIAVRLNNVLSGSLENTDAMLQSRTNTDYALSVSSCTNVTMRGNRSNYTRATNIYYCSGTGCTAYDNIGPAGTSMQYASGGAAASDSAMQRVA